MVKLKGCTKTKTMIITMLGVNLGRAVPAAEGTLDCFLVEM